MLLEIYDLSSFVDNLSEPLNKLIRRAHYALYELGHTVIRNCMTLFYEKELTKVLASCIDKGVKCCKLWCIYVESGLHKNQNNFAAYVSISVSSLHGVFGDKESFSV